MATTGNVGIGTTTPSAKLDVAGEIKLGNTASTCIGTNEGQQRYNSTSHLMEFCNGTAWTSLGGGAVASGTWCGYYDGSGTNATILCGGSDPNVSCPSGYTRVSHLRWLDDGFLKLTVSEDSGSWSLERVIEPCSN